MSRHRIAAALGVLALLLLPVSAGTAAVTALAALALTYDRDLTKEPDHERHHHRTRH